MSSECIRIVEILANANICTGRAFWRFYLDRAKMACTNIPAGTRYFFNVTLKKPENGLKLESSPYSSLRRKASFSVRKTVSLSNPSF